MTKRLIRLKRTKRKYHKDQIVNTVNTFNISFTTLYCFITGSGDKTPFHEYMEKLTTDIFAS